MFYSFTNNPKVPSLDFTKVNISDSTNFSQMMEANSKRDDILKLISLVSKNPSNPIDASTLKSTIAKLDASIDLVRNLLKKK